jgi:phenylalanine-4-hydroxylase
LVGLLCAVDGFIKCFYGIQAYNVLVIASDIRQLEHIEYTPAPDIIHEGAGHIIIANPEYAEYLRRFEIGCKAISSSKDYEMYEAIRLLSIVKAEGTPQATNDAAEKAVEDLQIIWENCLRWHRYVIYIGGRLSTV